MKLDFDKADDNITIKSDTKEWYVALTAGWFKESGQYASLYLSIHVKEARELNNQLTDLLTRIDIAPETF